MAVGAFASLVLLSSCGLLSEQTQRREDAYATLYRENPRSIVIMPTINETNQVELKDNFYATLLSRWLSVATTSSHPSSRRS